MTNLEGRTFFFIPPRFSVASLRCFFCFFPQKLRLASVFPRCGGLLCCLPVSAGPCLLPYRCVRARVCGCVRAHDCGSSSLSLLALCVCRKSAKPTLEPSVILLSSSRSLLAQEHAPHLRYGRLQIQRLKRPSDNLLHITQMRHIIIKSLFLNFIFISRPWKTQTI